MIKFFAGIIIIFGCGYLGIVFSERYKKRVKEIVVFEQILTELEYYMNYMDMTVPDALKIASRHCENEIKNIFIYISERLTGNPGTNMQKVWKRSFEKFQYGLSIKPEDIEILIDFSKNLGAGNREKEKNNINATKMRLKIAEEEARSEMKQNSKIYRGLGFLFGIFVFILLI